MIMKAWFVFFFLLLASASYAQTMMIGARGGVNLANEAITKTLYPENTAFLAELLGGGQLDYQFSNTWALSLQLLYDQKGAHIDMGPGYSNWTTSYLELPLLVKMSFGSGALRPYLFAGPSIGYLLSNIQHIHTNGSYFVPDGVGAWYPIDTAADITDSTAKIDFSLIAGAGLSLQLASGTALFFDAAYAYGFINSDNYSWDKADGISVYSRDIRLAAGVLFPLN